MYLKIRKIKKQDADGVAKLIRDTLRKVNAPHYPKRVITYLEKQYSVNYLKPEIKTSDIFVAMLGHKLVGTIRLTKDGWLCGLFVHLNHHNQDIGTKLVKKIVLGAKQRGFDALRSHVAINSVNFYKKLGFRIVKKVTFENAGETYRVILKLR